MRANGFHSFFLILFLAWAMTGCSAYQPVEEPPPQFQSSVTPQASSTFTHMPELTPTLITEPTFTMVILSPQPELTETAVSSPDTPLSCEENWCIYPGHFWLSSPVPGSKVDHTYRYGGTQQYQRETHHGIEFIDAAGTPVVAAADGTVVVAGTDRYVKYGLYKGFYGNLVIVEHQSPYDNQLIYTLYGHLSTIDVRPGDFVLRGQYIGSVGTTGAALGSHLHFEVRLGTNDYLSTCNPELWLQPDIDPRTNLQNGALAVRMMDGDTPIYTYPVLIEYYQDPTGPVTNSIYTESYAWDTPSNGMWQEQLAVNNLTPGLYRVSFTRQDRWFREMITIIPGQLTVVNFNAK